MESLAIRERILGPHNPEVKNSVLNISFDILFYNNIFQFSLILFEFYINLFIILKIYRFLIPLYSEVLYLLTMQDLTDVFSYGYMLFDLNSEIKYGLLKIFSDLLRYLLFNLILTFLSSYKYMNNLIINLSRFVNLSNK